MLQTEAYLNYIPESDYKQLKTVMEINDYYWENMIEKALEITCRRFNIKTSCQIWAKPILPSIRGLAWLDYPTLIATAEQTESRRTEYRWRPECMCVYWLDDEICHRNEARKLLHWLCWIECINFNCDRQQYFAKDVIVIIWYYFEGANYKVRFKRDMFPSVHLSRLLTGLTEWMAGWEL